MGYTVKKKTHN